MSVEFQIIKLVWYSFVKVNFDIFSEIPEFLTKYVLVHSILITEASIYFYFCFLHARWDYWLFIIHYKKKCGQDVSVLAETYRIYS